MKRLLSFVLLATMPLAYCATPSIEEQIQQLIPYLPKAQKIKALQLLASLEQEKQKRAFAHREDQSLLKTLTRQVRSTLSPVQLKQLFMSLQQVVTSAAGFGESVRDLIATFFVLAQANKQLQQWYNSGRVPTQRRDTPYSQGPFPHALSSGFGLPYYQRPYGQYSPQFNASPFQESRFTRRPSLP